MSFYLGIWYAALHEDTGWKILFLKVYFNGKSCVALFKVMDLILEPLNISKNGNFCIVVDRRALWV